MNNRMPALSSFDVCFNAPFLGDGSNPVSRLPNGRSRACAKALAVVLLATVTPSMMMGAIDRGNIQGTVADEQNAVIPGAKLVVKNLDTNVEVALTTNSAGVYQASELVPGRYSVRVEARGFSSVEVTD